MKIFNLAAAFTLSLLSGCRKKTKVYSIQGRLLESSSNPVPQAIINLLFIKGEAGVQMKYCINY